ncbi:Do family serine endopeptidase [Aestuariivirga sp. YIM B02566]|uniref:Do family serine endopeptidase n=1 Tax=Taklimakanibacter albus TaxID=2800327 RepID=A0ACC5RBI3_9HYPH|nr:Do family serine endopeptidase [Aestuariivirga sp. YIM B02566]MBK1869972.1 Do family serine endopeptidase [Aestuariivirga sp. YIM B02566]
MNTSTKVRNRVIGAMAFGLLAATALSANFMIAPSKPVLAETAQQVAPQMGFADLAAKVMPAVVSVEVNLANVVDDSSDEGQDGPGAAPPNLPQDSPFRDFFNQFPQFRDQFPQAPRQPRGGIAQGSGFVISADGYAVTNNHVVGNATKVSVKFSDGQQYDAKVIGTDPKTDLALIKIEGGKDFTFVKFSQKDPRVGDWVMAVGNPFGLGGTVTSGIISARGRDIGSGPYDDFLQIDASINKGNSGGPAFNLDGDVVGINTAIYSPSGGSVGIGFAIPAATAQDVIASLKDNGKVTRGWLGVQIQPVTDDIAEGLNLTDKKGALVADVTDKSPALAAGIKTGDTIIKVGADEISDPRDLAKKVARYSPGKSVDVTIVRNGKSMVVPVELGKMPGEKQELASAETASPERGLAELGVRLAPAEDGAGVKVIDVKPGSAAEDRGIRAGDVILEVAGKEVHEPSDVKAALQAAAKSSSKQVVMLIRSGDNQRFVALPGAGKG